MKSLYEKNPEMNITPSEYFKGSTMFHFKLADSSDLDLVPINV